MNQLSPDDLPYHEGLRRVIIMNTSEFPDSDLFPNPFTDLWGANIELARTFGLRYTYEFCQLGKIQNFTEYNHASRPVYKSHYTYSDEGLLLSKTEEFHETGARIETLNTYESGLQTKSLIDFFPSEESELHKYKEDEMSKSERIFNSDGLLMREITHAKDEHNRIIETNIKEYNSEVYDEKIIYNKNNKIDSRIISDINPEDGTVDKYMIEHFYDSEYRMISCQVKDQSGSVHSTETLTYEGDLLVSETNGFASRVFEYDAKGRCVSVMETEDNFLKAKVQRTYSSDGLLEVQKTIEPGELVSLEGAVMGRDAIKEESLFHHYSWFETIQSS